MAGLASGLRQRGVDLGGADLIVGTSAGAIVGAALATGQDPAELATVPRPADIGDANLEVDPGALDRVFGVLGDPSLEPADARRRAGQIAMTARAIPERIHVAQMGALITAREWPDRRLLITAVDAESGEAQVWGRGSGVPMVPAVAASCAMPGIYAPVTVNGRRYMDGSLRGGANVDLASGARLIALIEPLAHLYPAPRPEQGTVVAVGPDEATLRLFEPGLNEIAAWQPAYHAGLRQSEDCAAMVHAAWHADVSD